VTHQPATLSNSWIKYLDQLSGSITTPRRARVFCHLRNLFNLRTPPAEESGDDETDSDEIFTLCPICGHLQNFKMSVPLKNKPLARTK
jgi:hypothetical protein